MERDFPCRTASIALIALAAGALLSQPVQARGRDKSQGNPIFDLRDAPGGKIDSHSRQVDARLAQEQQQQERVKLRLVYQPIDAGPRFELGTIGAGKGAMKRTLVNVAFGWKF